MPKLDENTAIRLAMTLSGDRNLQKAAPLLAPTKAQTTGWDYVGNGYERNPITGETRFNKELAEAELAAEGRKEAERVAGDQRRETAAEARERRLLERQMEMLDARDANTRQRTEDERKYTEQKAAEERQKTLTEAAEGLSQQAEGFRAMLTNPNFSGAVGPLDALTGRIGGAMGTAEGTLGRQVEMRAKELVLEAAQSLKGALSDKDIKFLEDSAPRRGDTEEVWKTWYGETFLPRVNRARTKAGLFELPGLGSAGASTGSTPSTGRRMTTEEFLRGAGAR